MYANAARRGLGVLTPIDPVMSDALPGDLPAADWIAGGDAGGIDLLPTVVNTTQYPTMPAVVVEPVTVRPSDFPQQLPPIVATAPAPTSSRGLALGWLLVMLVGTVVVVDVARARHRGH